jgi:tRNA threonylcarbamoyladenosine biosynthesis protein TsaE
MGRMKDFTVASPSGMRDVAREAVAALEAAPRSGAAVLALSGDLGAGKTAFVQALADALGARGPVQSPTYVIMKKHELAASSPWRTLAHIDAYRLAGAADLSAIGWGNLVADPTVLIALEWPERVLGALPASAVPIKFEHENPTTRRVSLG